MADGIFTIKPRYLSDITCALGKISSVKYYVLPTRVHWNEQDRVKIAYASGGQGGFASGEQRGLSQATFEMVIFGTDMADAMSGLRTVTQALTSQWGGHIQYRPVGLDSGVLSTYYHYLQSSPPAIEGQGPLSDFGPQYVHSTYQYGIRCQCQVAIKAWATSDPASPATIKTSTSIQNFTDGSNVNYVIVENSSIKGDAVIPIVDYDRTDSESQLIAYMYVHRKRMVVGNTDTQDFIDSDDFSPAWTHVADASVCGGDYERTTTTDGSQVGYTFFSGMDRTYFGRISPIMCAKTSGEYTAYVSLTQTAAVVEQNDPVTIDSASWKLYKLGQLDFPIIDPPDYIPVANCDSWLLVAYLNLDVALVSAGNLDFDFLWIPKADDWITHISSIDPDSSANSLDTGDNLLIDGFTGSVYNGSPLPPTYTLISVWNVDGPKIDLVLEKGFDHKISFLASDENDLFRHAFEADVTVYGLYATIFPFETA